MYNNSYMRWLTKLSEWLKSQRKYNKEIRKQNNITLINK